MMTKEIRIIAIVPTLSDNPAKTIQNLKSQTIKVSKTFVIVGSKELFEELLSTSTPDLEYIYVKPDFSKSLGARVSLSINVALASINLEDYDYLIRVDADTVLNPNFLAANLQTNADLIGMFGFAMIIRISSFIRIMKGKWPEVNCEDTYLFYSFVRSGVYYSDYVLHPLTRKTNFHSWKYYFNRGYEMYRFGYEPLHVMALSMNIVEDKNSLFIIPGFVTALLQRKKRYGIADWLLNNQLRELLKFSELFKHASTTFFKHSK